MYQPGPPIGYSVLKLSSTPDDPSRAVLEGLSRLCGSCFPSHLNHATTVATNALLERTGGKVAFFCTEGFQDMLWLGRGQRDDLYALAPSRVEPPLGPTDCFPVRGRLGARGEEVEPLELPCLETLSLDFDTIAVCLIHSTTEPIHEKRLKEHLSQRFRRVFASHEMSSSSGEYERGLTALLAAYLSPKVEGYLQRLVGALSETQLHIVHSAGGLLEPREAMENPHRLALSGPAAGLRGALSVGLQCGESNLVTLDMGGTSTDVALLWDGRLPYQWSTKLEKFPLLAPTLEIHTIGAGGGSLAKVDDSGLLRVGPQSAGAQPGPACYGRGGQLATVTDALFWNGYLPEQIGDEHLVLDRPSCAQALGTLATHLGLEIDALADGILEVTANHLAQAVRKVTTARGQDPSTFTLFPFGGAGPLLSCQVAELLDIQRILVPARAGVLSAWGALTAPWEREWSLTVPVNQRENSDAVLTLLHRLERQALASSPDSTTWELEKLVARRYLGQGETLSSPPEQDFHSLHHERFGFSRKESRVQTLLVRLRATAPALAQGQEQNPKRGCTPSETILRREGRESKVCVYPPEHRFESATPGPLLWYQEGATVFVAPHWSAITLERGHLLLQRACR